MDWLAVITAICLDKSFDDKKACEAKFKDCVEWVSSQPEVIAADLTKFDVATGFLIKKFDHKRLCK